MAKAPLIVSCITAHPELLSTVAEALRATYPVVELRHVPHGAPDVATPAAHLRVIDRRNDGHQTVAQLHEAIPTIYITDTLPTRRRRTGANDLADWCHPNDLTRPGFARIAHYLIERHQLLQALANAQTTLKERSIRDDLTGVYNKRYLLDLLTQVEKKANRYGHDASLIVVDCDHFQEFNRVRGFTAGDQILTELAVLLQQTVREVDQVARFESDAFAILLPETGVDDARKTAERIRQAVEHYRTAVNGSAPIPTVSIGVAAFTVERRTAIALLEDVQLALLQAKRKGGNGIAVGGTTSPTAELLAVDQQLTNTLRHDIATFTQLARRDYFEGVHRIFTALNTYKHCCQSHAERVAFYADRLAAKIGLGEEEQATVRRGALLHDIGMAVLNEHVLMKGDPLLPPERTTIERHPILGVQLLEPSAFFRHELTIILHHHERMDGSGYPDHLVGNHIPFFARLVAITEAWDRMVEPQPYRAALPLEQALQELRAHAGTQFDPELVRTFCTMIAG